MTLAASPSTPSARLGRPLALLAGAALLAPTLLRPDGHGPVLCPLRRITGVWCPGCGMTRSFGWLAHGDLHQSLRYHPLAPLLLIEGVIGAAYLLYRRRAHRGDPPWLRAAGPERPFERVAGPERPFERVALPSLLVGNSLLVLVVWVIRLKLGSFDDLG
jgi:hypothetical protein